MPELSDKLDSADARERNRNLMVLGTIAGVEILQVIRHRCETAAVRSL